MTIHSEHPFADAEKDPVRRFRGRVGGAVTLWTAGAGATRAGLTVSSCMVAAGEPGHVLGLVDPDSELAEAALDTGALVVQLLEWRHRSLADAFAGVAPAPGGPFRLADWQQSSWGPVLSGVSWLGATALDSAAVGWSQLVRARVDHVDVSDESEPLFHRRGRYEKG